MQLQESAPLGSTSVKKRTDAFHLVSCAHSPAPEMTAATGTERNVEMIVFTSSMVTSISMTATANVCSMM